MKSGELSTDGNELIIDSAIIHVFANKHFIYAGNNTGSEVDMKKAKRMTVVYYRTIGKQKRNTDQHQVLAMPNEPCKNSDD